LAGDTEAGVLIIGAGFTGLSTALHCSEFGIDACVLEAGTPGIGASGRNAGQWLPGWIGKTPAQVETMYGRDAGARLNTFNVQAAALVPALVRQHGIQAELRVCGILQVAGGTRGLRRLHDLAAQWNRYGASISVLDRAGLQPYLLTDSYRGGILLHDGGCLNPLAYALGLADAARRAGACIHCDSPAISLVKAGSRWEVRTPGGKVTATHVVIATDATGSPPLWTGLNESYYRLPIPMLCSETLGGGGRDFLPQATPFAEIRPSGLLFGGMLDPAGRWIASTAPYFRSNNMEILGAWALRRFRKVFPQVAPFRWERLWWGDLGVSRDTLPRVYALGPGVHAVNGYSGGGIALATALGRALARMLAAGDARELPIAPLPLESVPLRRVVPALLRDMAMPLARTLDGLWG
jgi:glycine/D-amino acid oxidase-like deaminating enzyme